jgi:hypothetical protein
MPAPSSFKSQVEARIRELRPAHEEYLALLDLQKTLGRTSTTTPRRGRPPGRRAAKGTGRRRGRPPKGAKTRADETLDMIKSNPGISVSEIADRMKIRQNYLYRVTAQLQKQGAVQRRNGGFHAKSK